MLQNSPKAQGTWYKRLAYHVLIDCLSIEEEAWAADGLYEWNRRPLPSIVVRVVTKADMGAV